MKMSVVRSAEIRSRVDRQFRPDLALPFWKKCQRGTLSVSKFSQLLDTGFCVRTFTEAGDLMFAFRARGDEQQIRANFDVIALDQQRSVGILDFSIRGGYAVLGRKINLSEEGFSSAAEQRLRRSGFASEWLDPGTFGNQRVPSKDGSAAFWIRTDYRSKRVSGDELLSFVLAHTTARIIAGLGVRQVKITEAPVAVLHYYIKALGAEYIGGAGGVEALIHI